ncbi:MAG: PD-(D/E)XK nuclease family protein [Candidatus Acidiferrum sp.]
MNLLEVLGISSKEDVISNLLRYCLEVSPTFCKVFLDSICGICSSDLNKARAFTRISTDSSGIPDLVIAAESSRQRHLVILENKLKANEGDDQTVRYSSAECVREVKNRIGWSGIPVTETFVFLTLFPDQEPGAQVFRRVTYEDLLKAAPAFEAVEDSLAHLLLEAWVSLLKRFYSKGSVSPEDFLLTKLQETDPLEGNFLYFKSFVETLSLSRNLTVEQTFRSSAQGRRFFGAIISKDSWHPAEMQELSEKYELDGRKHFNIHFEPQFHYLKGVMELYVHYEVNPYQTAEWVKTHVRAEQLAAYTNVREQFVNELRKKSGSDLLIGGRTNQIAKARLALQKATVSGASEEISAIINRVALNIDQLRDDPMGVFAS